jgi:hypothetical protein
MYGAALSLFTPRRTTMSKDHPGFKGAVKDVERKEGMSKASAEKVIGAGKAHASEEAREKNPRLNKKGGR